MSAIKRLLKDNPNTYWDEDTFIRVCEELEIGISSRIQFMDSTSTIEEMLELVPEHIREIFLVIYIDFGRRAIV